MGLVVDIVPNHMSADAAANPWWWDVLRNGDASEHAHCSTSTRATPRRGCGAASCCPCWTTATAVSSTPGD